MFSEKLENYLRIPLRILGGLGVAAGIVIGIIGLDSDNISNRVLFWTLLISFIIVLICGGVTMLQYLCTNIRSKKYKEENQKLNSYIEEITIFIKDINKTLESQQVSLYSETERYFSDFENAVEKSNSFDVAQSEEFKEHCIKNFQEQRMRFETNVYEIYNIFIGRIIRKSKSIIERHIDCRDYNLNVSVSIKMLNEPISKGIHNSNIFDDDIFVYTAFRDEASYDEKKREIAQKSYTIRGNTDFTQCCTEEFFMRNNVQRSDRGYVNERADFDNYYNCVVTVPIIYGSSSDKTLYGYLCCDTLNNMAEYKDKDIFDMQVVNILFSVASNIGIFLNQAFYAWYEGPSSISGNNFTMDLYSILSDKYKFISERVL